MSLPLSGLKVLDFTTLLPGPYATQLLADMGAEVLRIESPTRPDLLKVMPPYVNKVSASHATINRNKKSLAIDLKQPDARGIIEDLLGEYDVILEQFRPGVMKRLGLDFETLKAKNERLIYCSITGYGQTGPKADKAGHDINYLALSGLASYSGRKETGPTLAGTQIADIAGGSHHAVMAILAAVIERHSSGQGQYLDISMTDAAFALNTMFGANALVSGESPSCGTEMLNGGLFYDYYETSDQRYLSIGSLEPNFAKNMLEALDLSDWLSKSLNQSIEVQSQLKDVIATQIKSKTLSEWVEIFKGVDACVEPVLTIEEAADSSLIKERGMLVDVNVGDGFSIKQVNSALPFKRNGEFEIGRELGADSHDALLALGYDDVKIDALVSSGCVKLA